MPYSITENCKGCTLCERNCPVNAIEGKPKLLHHINEKRCIECGVCGNVCNFNAILDNNGELAKKTPKNEWPIPNINQQLCSACAICVSVCGKDCLAISLPVERGDIHVFAYLKDDKKCVACGLCEIYCPLKAIKMIKKEVAE